MRGQQHARGTEAALQRVMLEKRLLQVFENPSIGEPLDGTNLLSLCLNSQHEAAAHQGVIDQDGAGATDPMLAAQVRAREIEAFAQEIHQVHAGRDLCLYRFTVDLQAYNDGLGIHEVAPNCWITRLRTTPARYDLV
nr:hypothetical protein NCPCFENI_01277 [Cupriavidus sp.]